MTSRQFWHCTPRKFDILCKRYMELHATKDKKQTTSTGVGTPDTFIDQI